MAENLGEINVKVNSEGVDETSEEMEDMGGGEAGATGEGEEGVGGQEAMLGNISENTSETSGGMLAMAGGIGAVIGMLANMEGMKDMFSGLMKILQTLFMPMAMMIMKALGPIIRTLTKMMPRIWDVMDDKMGKVASVIGAIGGAIIGGVLGGGPGAILGALLGSMIPVGVDMLLEYIFGDTTITKWDILDKIFPGTGEVGSALGYEGAEGTGTTKWEGVPKAFSFLSPIYGSGMALERIANWDLDRGGQNGSGNNGGEENVPWYRRTIDVEVPDVNVTLQGGASALYNTIFRNPDSEGR